MNKETRLNIGYALAAVFGVLLLHSVITAAVSVTAIPYSEFRQYLHEGKVADVNVSDRYVEGTLKEKLPNGSAKFSTTRVDPDLANELQQYRRQVQRRCGEQRAWHTARLAYAGSSVRWRVVVRHAPLRCQSGIRWRTDAASG